MNFALSDEQQQIRDAAQAFLADVCGSAALRRSAELPAGYDPAVWQRLAGELGWCATAIPEAHEGLGLGPVEFTLIQEQCGYRLLNAPLLASAGLAATVLTECATTEARQQYLPRIAAGALIASVPLGHSAAGWLDPARAPQAHRHGEGWRLESDRLRVPNGDTADVLLVFAQIGERLTGLFALPRGTAGVQVTPEPTWDTTRRFAAVELRGVELTAAQRIDDGTLTEGFARSAALARLYLAAEQLGGAQACLDLTVAYTATRQQFGRAIASFQAVKHRCAEMMVRVEATRSAVYGAAAFAADAQGRASAAGAGCAGAADPADVRELERECAMAKAMASETFFHCAQEAVQLHGGVGFTWEYDPQLYFKRAQASSHWLGSAEALRGRIAALLIDETTENGADRLSV
jgi:alkylation response protein AidB-like acyl-CoA dehydrogenase